MSDADLADLMRRAAQHQMTPAERQAQKISLVCGLLPEDSPLTKDDVAKMIYARDGNLAEMEARIAELEAEIVDQKRMRREEKDKILRQRAEIVSLMKENRRHLSMARGLQKRVAALETAQAEMAGREGVAQLGQINEVTRNLSQGMEPMGPDFERVWDENLDALLSDDPLP
jgi:chromosome segregation ATPase